MKGRNKGKTVIFALTERGLGLSKKIEGALGSVEVLKPTALSNGGLKKEAGRAFRRADALVFISATGIAIRCVAPLLKGKHVDPAIVVVDERGRFSVSLLSGHMGGANALAERIARATGATAVITTATDIWGLPSAEELAEKFSLVIEDPRKIKAANSAILEGKKVFVADSNAKRLKEIKGSFKNVFTCRKSLPEKLGGREAAILITSRLDEVPIGIAERTLTLRPKEIIAGIGCGKGVGKSDIKKALLKAFNKAGLSILSVKAIATIDIKKNEKGLCALAKEMGIPIEAYPAKELVAVNYPSRPSKAVRDATGAGAVCEPAALLSSGAEKLCLKKTKTGRVTIAAAFLA